MAEDKGDSRTIGRRKYLSGTAAGLMGLVAGCEDSGDDEGNGSNSDGGNELGDPVEETVVLSPSGQQDPTREQLSKLQAEALNEHLGVPTAVETMDFDSWLGNVFTDRTYDIAAITWSPTVERLDPDIFIYSHLGHPDETYNMGAFNHSEYREVATEQRRTTDQDARQELVYKAQDIQREEVPSNFLYSTVQWQAHRTDTFTNWKTGLGQGHNNLFAWLDLEPGSRNVVRSGRTLVVNFLNPMRAVQNNSFQEITKIYDRLIEINLDGEVVPWLAEDWEIEDGRIYHMTLRDDAQWHDGEDVTVEDVKFTFEYYLEHEHPYTFGTLDENLESIEITGDRTITFTLTEPFAPALQRVFFPVFILPQHLWQDVDEPLTVNIEDVTVGSGPFKFGNWNRGDELVFESNPDHWYSPNIDGIRRLIYGSDTTILEEVMQNNLDKTDANINARVAQQYQDQDPENVEVMGYQTHGRQEMRFNIGTTADTKGSGWEKEEPPKILKDRNFRQAAALVTDQHEFLDIVENGNGNPIQDSISAPEFWNKETELWEFDVDKARQLLEDAGYGWDSNDRLHYPVDGIDISGAQHIDE